MRDGIPDWLADLARLPRVTGNIADKRALTGNLGALRQLSATRATAPAAITPPRTGRSA